MSHIFITHNKHAGVLLTPVAFQRRRYKYEIKNVYIHAFMKMLISPTDRYTKIAPKASSVSIPFVGR